MPTRSYYFPEDYAHFEAILGALSEPPSEEVLSHFRRLGVAPIVSESAISIFLGISPKILYSIKKKTSRHYRKFLLKKKDGTFREINAPRTYLKVIQWWIADNVFRNSKVDDFVYGFVPGRSVVSNAAHHFGANHILNLDIKAFFPSVTLEQVASVFSGFGYSPKVVEVLSELCCLDGSLPQGAPTSPAIANHVLAPVDIALAAMAMTFGCKYSRYADDLTFSSNNFIPTELLVEATGIIESYSFDVKKEKVRFSGRGQRMEITGVVINENLQLPRTWRRNARAKMHRMSLKDRLIRSEIHYLYGVRGVAMQFSGAVGMDNLKSDAERLIERFKGSTIHFGDPSFLPLGLTRGEGDVLIRLARGRKNAAIAAMLDVSESTIKKRLTSAFRKIGASDRVAAEAWATANL